VYIYVVDVCVQSTINKGTSWPQRSRLFIPSMRIFRVCVFKMWNAIICTRADWNLCMIQHVLTRSVSQRKKEKEGSEEERGDTNRVMWIWNRNVSETGDIEFYRTIVTHSAGIGICMYSRVCKGEDEFQQGISVWLDEGSHWNIYDTMYSFGNDSEPSKKRLVNARCILVIFKFDVRVD